LKIQFIFCWGLFLGGILGKLQAQEILSDTTIFLKKSDYQGVIFNQYSAQIKLSPQDIIHAEEALTWFMEKQRRKRSLPNQGGECPYIHRKLRKYKRQYLGELDEKGRKVVRILAFLESETYFFPTWKQKIVQSQGGCSHFWEIKVRLKTQKCYDYRINPRN